MVPIMERKEEEPMMQEKKTGKSGFIEFKGGNHNEKEYSTVYFTGYKLYINKKVSPRNPLLIHCGWDYFVSIDSLVS